MHGVIEIVNRVEGGVQSSAGQEAHETVAGDAVEEGEIAAGK